MQFYRVQTGISLEFQRGKTFGTDNSCDSQYLLKGIIGLYKGGNNFLHHDEYN